MRLADRLRALDDHIVWIDAPKPRLTPGTALALGLLAVGVYVGWALVWSWPLALVGVVALVAVLTAIARFFFGDHAQTAVGSRREGRSAHDRRAGAGLDAERRPRVPVGGIRDDVDEVRRARVEAAT